jgi:hypothetical protein
MPPQSIRCLAPRLPEAGVGMAGTLNQASYFSTRCQPWKVYLPLMQQLRQFVWEAVREELKAKLLK